MTGWYSISDCPVCGRDHREIKGTAAARRQAPRAEQPALPEGFSVSEELAVIRAELRLQRREP